MSQFQALYNTDVSLWQNAKEHYRKEGIVLEVVDSHIHHPSDGWVARFETHGKAIDCLIEAGYVFEGNLLGKAIFRP